MLADNETQDRLNQQLVEAVILGDTARVRELIAEGVDPADEDSCALRWAAQDGRLDIVRILLDDGRANPRDDASACLRYAAEFGHTETVRLLLEDGRAEPADEQSYALRWACGYGHTDVVRALLLDGRADPLAAQSEALRFAVQHGHTDTVRALLEDIRVDPGAENGEALSYAAQSGYTEIVHAFLKHGRVNPAAQGCQAFRHAAVSGNTHVVCFLLAAVPDYARLPMVNRLLDRLDSHALPNSVVQFLRACRTEPLMPRMLNIVRALLQTDTPSGSIFALASEAARRNMPAEMVLQVHARGVLNSVLRTTLGARGRIPTMSTINQHGDLTALASVSKAEPALQGPGWRLHPAQFQNIIFELAPALAPQVVMAIWDTLRAQVRGKERPRNYGRPAQRVRDRMAANILLTAAAREYNAFIADAKDDAQSTDARVSAAANALLSALSALNDAVQRTDTASITAAQAQTASAVEAYAELLSTCPNEAQRAKPAQRFALVRSILRMPSDQLVELAQVQARERPSRKRSEIAL